ncbi:pectinesterase 3-like [Impatiens glandulifera]|uniref:pectinesterase 3-like n=1 Tax=Impatiens glandulifera TaxID=253017 RepID=UPI001FB1325B|nr:pectinesterase 3-like [Impatiens glandulifera]
MDAACNSFQDYGKIGEPDHGHDDSFRCKSRNRKITLIVSSAIFLVAVAVGVVAGTFVHKSFKEGASSGPPPIDASVKALSGPLPIDASVKTLCSVTQYPSSCSSSIESLNTNNCTSHKELFKLSLYVAANDLAKLATFLKSMISNIDDERVHGALGVCQEVINGAIGKLNDSISTTTNKVESLLTLRSIDDLVTWLSAAITDHETCLDALSEVNATKVLDKVRELMRNSTEFTSNSLAIVSKVLGIPLSTYKIPIHHNRRLLGEGSSLFPKWMGHTDHKLLETANPTPDIIVAKDGTGNVTTIMEGVAKIPKKSNTRFIIYVKAGEYVENVKLDKSLTNVMMYGDGNLKTIVSGSLNFVDGTPTFSTATFAVMGGGFIARDIGFVNTAGAAKHQAVALISGADQSVFYRCSFNAFQDTLYTYSGRQFYRDCSIIGTVDFIFGNAAVVFQNCSILPRQPLPGQFVALTAQGKTDPNQNTGIVIQKCTLTPFDSLTSQAYLGRPWKNYSTTVFMQTQIGSFLNPAGWISWDTNVDPPDTILYAEYMNEGPGSDTTKRVTWAGYKPNLSTNEASKFTVKSFIDGTSWLPETNVTFDDSL